MNTGKPKNLHYKRSHFATQLPADYLYSPSHFWLAKQEGGLWRVGYTKFAVRMLGETVDCALEVEKGAAVEGGLIIGWIEGFKAIADIYCVVNGKFAGINPALKEKINLVNKDCYGAGWIYQARGTPDAKCVDVNTYQQVLDKTIDKIMEKQKGDEIK